MKQPVRSPEAWPRVCPRSGGKGRLRLEPRGARVGFAVAAARPGCGTCRGGGVRSHPLHEEFQDAQVWEHGVQRL